MSPEPPDAGPAGHHWLLAVAAGALFGMVEVLVAWIWSHLKPKGNGPEAMNTNRGYYEYDPILDIVVVIQMGGKTPGVFAYTKAYGEDRFTWQPRRGVRSAVVLMAIPDASNSFVIETVCVSLLTINSILFFLFLFFDRRK